MNKLLQLAIQNRASPPAIVCAAAGDRAEVFLKGVIYADEGVGADALRGAMQQADGRPVALYINSPGGDVFEAREMQAIIAAHPAEVTAIVQGVAASAGTIVAMAASRIEISRGSRYMIHNGLTMAFGNRHDLKARFDLLEAFDAELAAEYAAKTGGKVDAQQVAAWMDAETWFTAEQAVQHGLVDAVIPNTQNAALSACWDLSAYANAPQIEAGPSAADIAAQAERQYRFNRSRLALAGCQT